MAIGDVEDVDNDLEFRIPTNASIEAQSGRETGPVAQWISASASGHRRGSCYSPILLYEDGRNGRISSWGSEQKVEGSTPSWIARGAGFITCSSCVDGALVSHASLLLLLAMHGYEGRSAASGMAEERDKVDGGSNARATDLL